VAVDFDARQGGVCRAESAGTVTSISYVPLHAPPPYSWTTIHVSCANAQTLHGAFLAEEEAFGFSLRMKRSRRAGRVLGDRRRAGAPLSPEHQAHRHPRLRRAGQANDPSDVRCRRPACTGGRHARDTEDDDDHGRTEPATSAASD
jgi:hypothetical protein